MSSLELINPGDELETRSLADRMRPESLEEFTRLLSPHGRDLTTGNEVSARFETESIMSREEVAAAKSRNLALEVA